MLMKPVGLRDPFCIIMRYCGFSVYIMAALLHLSLLKLKFLTDMHFRDTFCMTVPNFMVIGHIDEIQKFMLNIA